jgi:MFS transporter, DHA1 family, multidrug resistance protein
MATTVGTQPLPSQPATETVAFRLLLVAFTAIGPFSLNVFKPCLPWIRNDFGAPLATVQLALSLSILVAAASTVVSGWISDRLGRRPVLLSATWLYIASCALCAVAPNIKTVIVGRMAQAATSTVGLIVSRSIVQDVYGKRDTARVFGRLSFVGLALVLVAPAFGGLLIEALGWRAVFVASAILGVLLVLAALRCFPETRPPSTAGDAAGEDGGPSLLRSAEYQGYVWQSSFHFGVFFAFSSVATYLMVDVLHRSASEYGLWFLALAGALGCGAGLGGNLAHRFGNARLVLVGSAIAFAGGALGARTLVADQLTPLRLFAPAVLSAFGMGLTLPTCQAGATAVNPRRSGTASGFMGLAQLALAAGMAQLVVEWPGEQTVVLAGVVAGGTGIALVFGALPVAFPSTERSRKR